MSELIYLPYCRVSTEEQGRSGLGLEGQQGIIEHFARADKATLLPYVIEVESGKATDNRPLLNEAIAQCKRNGYFLVVAKLDRLSRDVQDTFRILKELDGKLKSFDIPMLDSFTLAIFAGLAMRERELISLRTKLALQAKKARGEKMGTPRNLTSEARKRGNENAQRKTQEYKQDRILIAVLKSLQADGMDNDQIAQELNKLNFATFRGKPFNSMSVWRLIQSTKKTNDQP